MLSWTYRMVRDKQGHVQMAEVYFNQNGTQWGWCRSEPFVSNWEIDEGHSPSLSIRRQLQHMLAAAQYPILDATE